MSKPNPTQTDLLDPQAAQPSADADTDPGADDGDPKSLEDALRRWPHLRKDLAPRVQAALAERLKNRPPAAPAIPPEVQAQLQELETLRVAHQKIEDDKKRSLLEHMILAVLQPKYSDENSDENSPQ